jgi:acyl transferase domain-containing protein/phosphopantetheinyl transferase
MILARSAKMAEPVAIVGMAVVFPGAPDLDTFRRNIEAGRDAIVDAPASRIDPVYFADASRDMRPPSSAAAGQRGEIDGAPDRLYCRRGGFIELAFDPVAFGIMPVAAAGAEPDQLLALHVAARALDDAALAAIPRDRTAVILGRGGYLTPGIARLAQRVRDAEQLVATLAELAPDLDRDTLDKVRAAFAERAGTRAAGADAAIGLVPNLAASRIANRLDLRGPAYTIDAACASSLVAVDHACRELTTGRCDLVLAGGVHVCHDVTFWSVFAQLGALSRAQQIRPFDRRADGILVGEGCGIVVLERLADAERAGHRVYAVIKGVGVSSDGAGTSPMRPRADGQLAALDAAWREAGRDPATVGLVEAHGTGTPTGDEVELATLARFFGAADPARARAALGSIKSMIGHAMPAAGAAGLVKAALAIHHGVLPPSLHCEEPRDELAATRFRVLAAAEPWDAEVRRAGASAFGFGGINAHVVLEGTSSTTKRVGLRTSDVGLRPEILTIAAESPAALLEVLAGTRASSRGPARLALADPTPERRALAMKIVERGKRWAGRNDAWFAPDASGGKIAFVFPGIEAAFAPDLADLRELGDARAAAIEAAAAHEDIERRGLGVFALGRALGDALAARGVNPDVICGHSLGEWTGMVASEMIPPDAADAFVAGLEVGTLAVPDVVFAAVGCGADGARAALTGLDRISVSHDNCPHQSIVCGHVDSVRAAIARLGERGVLCQELPFRSGFHSPLFESYLAPHRARLAALALQAPRVAMWSATTCAPYPRDPDAIRALAIAHLVEPVRFRELALALYDDGVRAFVQLGVGSAVGFVDDTLRGRDQLAIAAAGPRGQLARVAAALWAFGFVERAAEKEPPRAAKPIQLQLGAPLVRLGDGAPRIVLGKPIPRDVSDPVTAEALAAIRDAEAAARAVVDAWEARQRAPHGAPTRELTWRRQLSVGSSPELLDHCFYRQPDGWPVVDDRYPVVPMTMTIAMMIDAAKALAPNKVATSVLDVRAYRWLAVAPSVTVELRATRTGDDVAVELPGYARATIRLADAYPPAPRPKLPPLASPRAAPVTAERMYVDRWMFHGPAYQGVVALGPMSDDGVDGAIAVRPAQGALLDCAGQLMGWHVMATQTRDRLAMPVHVERIELFDDDPRVGDIVDCRVRFRSVGEQLVRADHELVARGALWARITGWEDRRFDSDDAVWSVLMVPERNALAEPQPGGWVRVVEHWRAAASRELMMRRYLGADERARFDALAARKKRGWLLGRIAIKDAARQHLWARGAGPMWPVEIEVDSEPNGRPVVVGRPELHVSVAHDDDVAVAIVSDRGAVGIDVEKIAPRADGFSDIAFHAHELALGGDRDRDEWMTRLWCAKEAVGKARGTGVTDPKKLQVRAANGDRLELDEFVVETTRDGDYIVAWTVARSRT